MHRLWTVFKMALEDKPLENPEFLKSFDAALEVPNTNINLTMGLFWIRPDTFLNLDSVNRQYLKIKLPPAGLNSTFYLEAIRGALERGQPFYELSHKAWLAAKDPVPPPDPVPAPGTDYWMVGSFWDGSDPQDQTQRFLEDGIWENGYEDRYLDEVRSMKVGDKIAVKSAVTQKNNLPFDGRGKTVSKLIIKAVGTIIANRGDGTTVEVEWDPQFQQKDWFFYTNRTTVWHLPRDEEALALIAFTFFNKPQDYDWFIEKWWGPQAQQEPPTVRGLIAKAAYGVTDIVESGCSSARRTWNKRSNALGRKRTSSLQDHPALGRLSLPGNSPTR